MPKYIGGCLTESPAFLFISQWLRGINQQSNFLLLHYFKANCSTIVAEKLAQNPVGSLAGLSKNA